MARKPGVKAEIARELLKKFPDGKILTLARIAYKNHPEVYANLNEARSNIQYHAGQRYSNNHNGKKYTTTNKEFVRPPASRNPFNLPESYAEPWDYFFIKESRTIVLSDLHFPYQDNQAITAALVYALEKKPQCILLNGDIIDFAPISRHEKDWRQRSVSQEFEAVREFLKKLRAMFPSARIIYKLGNHDERWEKWLTLKAPELLDCSDFELEVLLRFGENKIEVVKDKRIIMIGKLPVLHGHELAGNGGVNPGRSTFLKTYSSALIGHVHKRSVNENQGILGEQFSTQSMGCLCGMHPKFMRINQWNHGFAYVVQDKDGNYALDNIKILNGQIVK